jgi:hypothetical protein
MPLQTFGEVKKVVEVACNVELVFNDEELMEVNKFFSLAEGRYVGVKRAIDIKH